MPLEFPCIECEHSIQLTTPVEEGETTCPNCQTPQQVPNGPSGGHATTSNPFSSPTLPEPPAPSRELAQSRLMKPAIGVIVIVVLGLIADGIPQVMDIVRQVTKMTASGYEGAAGQIGSFAGAFTVTAVYVLLNVLTLQSMNVALKVREYSFVLTGFILAMLPFTTGYFCVLALPFAIWGIVVLCDSSVQAAFRLTSD